MTSRFYQLRLVAISVVFPWALVMVTAPSIVFVAGQCVVAAEPAAPPARNDGLSVVHVGNSHSHPLRLLVPLNRQVGHAGFKEGHVNILGASLGCNWEHPEQNKWPTTLAATNKWDAITLLSWDNGDNKFAPRFAGEVYKANPKCQVYIYTIWPDADMSHDNPPPVRALAHGEAAAAAVAAAFPNAPMPRVIPSSLLIRELGRLADRGELPHIASRFALYMDGGHLSDYGAYAVNTMICAMLYQESPLAYPADIYQIDSQGQPRRGTFSSVTIPEETADVIKRTVWDILQTYPCAGMKPMLVIADRHVEPVIAGQPCKVELKALNASGPCVWSIVKGTLPEGLSLSRDGVLAGQSGAVGNYPLNIQLTDGKDRFERPLMVQVNQDRVPAIPDQALETVSLDRYVFQPLKVDGGVGHITWGVSVGKLPYGIMLSPAGILVGSPGEEGEFTFKIRAEDSHPSGPRAAEKLFTWKIGPATPETLQVKSLAVTGKLDDKTVVIDGKLDEPFWKLDQKIAKKVKGTPAQQASFGAVWTRRSRNDKKIVGDQLILAFKVLDGPKGKTPKDGVHIFIDGNHDRKLIYGADDTHFFIPRKHKGGWANTICGKVNWFTSARVQEIEGGYTMEISLSGKYFTGTGNWLPFGPKGVYGFDVAVDEGDGKEISQQVWHGDANNAGDTSHFGAIVLVNEPAMDLTNSTTISK